MAVRSVNRPGWNLEMLVFLFAHRSEDKGCAELRARRTSGKSRHGAKTRLPDAQLWPPAMELYGTAALQVLNALY